MCGPPFVTILFSFFLSFFLIIVVVVVVVVIIIIITGLWVGGCHVDEGKGNFVYLTSKCGPLCSIDTENYITR